jgi:kumamolisin
MSGRCAPLAWLLAATVCAGCGGGRTTPEAPAGSFGSGGSQGASSTARGAFGYDAAFVQASQYTGPASFGSLSLDVVLPMRDAAGLRAYAASVSEPRSANYRHFLTATDIGNRFGASASDQSKAEAYFRSFGLAVGAWRQRMLLSVSGSQAALQAAFRTTFGTYRNPTTGESFIAPVTAPSVAAGVPVTGSPNIVFRYKPVVPQFEISTGTQFGLSPQQLAAAYDYNGAYAAGYTGAGITIGVIAAGPLQTSTGGKIGDAEAYKALYHVGGSSTVTLVPTTSSDPAVDGASGFASPPAVTPPCTASGDPGVLPPGESPVPGCDPEDPNEPEAQLDAEQVAALARDANVEFYLAYNPDDGCSGPVGQPCPPVGSPGGGFPLQGLGETDEEVQTAIDHGTSDIISISYGEPENQAIGSEFNSNLTGLGPSQFEMLASEGVAVFVSSGDNGAEGCQVAPPGPVDSLCVQYPATDPNVVAVGAVTTPVNSAGALVGPIAAWGLQTSYGSGGTGGGVSAYFPLPSWQQGAAGVAGSTRNVPDVALNGDPATGASVLIYGDPSFGDRVIESVGGTSESAPDMAAMWALVLQACKQNAACAAKGSGPYPYRLGDPNPLFYQTLYKNASVYGSTFLSVTYGNNSQLSYCYQLAQLGESDPTDCPPGASPPPDTLDPGYSANPSGGYNNLTGLGVPFARALIKAVVGV